MFPFQFWIRLSWIGHLICHEKIMQEKKKEEKHTTQKSKQFF